MKKNHKTFSQIWVDDNEESWLVSYHYEGNYYPATLEDPEEYPELQIDEIVSKTDGRDFGDPTEEIINYIDKYHDGVSDEEEFYNEE